MRSRILLGTAIALAIVASACTRQEPTPPSQQGPVEVGQRAPAFSLESAGGGTVSLSDYAGRPVLLYFSMGPG
jgi:cytochrome oxidase Cu insertion factor (SCO1/SenC/PrrC family)